MTRMFKQLVASSRKKLSKAIAPSRQDEPAAQAPQVLGETRKKPDFEPLESRVLFSGVGTGFNKKNVRFTDAWGDAVLVRLIGGPSAARFDITLDGGARNHADIENITINGSASASTVLDVLITPKALTMSDTYSGGQTITGDPVHTVYAKTVANRTFTPGFVQIGSIIATTNIRGISMNGADFQNIDVTGSVGTGSRVVKGVTHPLHGGIAVDIGDSQFRTGLLNDPFSKIDFGNINVSGSVDSLILQGRSTTPSSNNLVGSITVGGTLGSIDAQYSDVLAPITVGSMGGAFFHNVLANITSAAAIGQLDAHDVVGDVSAVGAVAGVSLSGSLIGTLQAGSFGAVSVNGNFTGLLQAETGGIGNVVINSDTAFTGTIEAIAGNIGNITLSQATTPFSAHITADAGSIGVITAGFFTNAAVNATAGISGIVSNATTATVSSGIVNSVFKTTGGAIGNISSVASITNSQFEAVGGAIGSVTVLQGGISGAVFGGSTTTLATSVGNITANLSIENTSVIAAGAIGNITSIAGHIGGSSNTASTSTAGNPKSDVFIGGSIGNIYALGDISGNVITATAGNIGNITSHEGRLAFDSVNATGNIGNVYANSQDASFAFDSAGNVLGQPYEGAAYGVPIPSASAIDHSYFGAGGSIGAITAHASAVGGYFTGGHIVVPGGAGGAGGVGVGVGVGGHYYGGEAGVIGGGVGIGYGGQGGNGTGGLYEFNTFVHNAAIDYSVFSAATGIGKTIATDASTFDGNTYGHPLASSTSGHISDYNAAIRSSTFEVTGAGLTGLVMGPVIATGVGGNAITYSTFHTASGNIGYVTGVSTTVDGIYKSVIEADSGNIGIVRGINHGSGGKYHGGDGLNNDVITAGSGPAGTGTIAGVYGRGAYAGINNVEISAGAGGIGYIMGVSTGTNNVNAHDGIGGGTRATSTGPIGNITGASASGSGIDGMTVTGLTIGNITGATSGTGSGITDSGFYAQHGIGNITGTATTAFGNYGIDDSSFHSNVPLDGNGSIGNITGATAGKGSGIEDSTFISGNNIGAILGSATGAYGHNGIAYSKFIAGAPVLGTGAGSITSITGTSAGDHGTQSNGIAEVSVYAAGAIGPITGTVTNTAGGSGIADAFFTADSQHLGTGAIASITGATVAKNGYGILDATFASSGITGAVYGGALGAYSKSGIADSTFNADVASKFTSTIGSITGVSKASSGSASGILDSTFTAGYSIGSITGTTTAPGNNSYGIGDSVFYANAGTSSETGGVGKIGNITGTSNANGAAGYHAGIGNSTFVAGGGPSSTGTIGTVTGISKLNGAGSLYAYGISDSTFVAGSGKGAIGNVTGYALAQGSTPDSKVFATGIASTNFYAGTGLAGASSGAIGSVTATGIAESAFGNAYAYGIAGSLITAGGTGTGSIGAITALATASGQNTAFASGIVYSSIYSATLSDGSGAIGNISATATATSHGNSVAIGIGYTTIAAGYAYGKIGTISGAATATGETHAYAAGISGYAIGSYDSSTTITTGGGHTAGVGVIGAITGTATASANEGNATAIGIAYTGIHSGYATGSIGTVTASATATAGAGNASATGIYDTAITAALGFNGSGAITSVTATATATAASGTAYAYGIDASTISSGLNHGTIGNVTGTATATVTGTNASAGYAIAVGIGDTNILAGYSGVFGSIGNVTGTATATIHSSYENSDFTAHAYAAGLVGDNIYAQAALGGKYALDNGAGSIGKVTGAGTALAYGYQVAATGYGIADSAIVSSHGDLGAGALTGVYGTGIAKAVGNDYGAVAVAYGIGSSDSSVYIKVGTGLNSTGTIGNISGTGTATAISPGNVASNALATGIYSAVIEAGTGSYHSVGTIGNVTGAATATATSGTAGAYSYGILNSSIEAGRITGTIGAITGAATSTATSYYGNAVAKSHGIEGAYIIAGGDKGVGIIGAVTGAGKAYANAKGTLGAAQSYAYGIDPTTISAGSYFTQVTSATAGTGTIASITGTAVAKSTALGANTTASSKAFGIDGLYVNLGVAYSYVGSAIAGTGTITNGITGSATATSTATNSGSNGIAKATGIAGLYVYTADAYGVGYSKGGTGTIGALTAQATATVNAANNAFVYTYGLNTVKLSAGNATAGDLKTDLAFGGTGTIGAISQTQSSTATAGKPYGDAKAIAKPIVGLYLFAGNAYAGAAYGGTGSIASKGQIAGAATASAVGYTAYADAIGLENIRASAGNAAPSIGSAIGNYYATGGTGYVGQLVGTATATANSTKTSGSVGADAVAIGIDQVAPYAKIYAGNAEITNTAATASAFGGHGALGGFVGTATATSYAKSPFNGASEAHAAGIAGIYAYAGNAANFGKGPAKTVYGKIGVAGPIIGTGTATSTTKGGGTASSTAYAAGISGISLNAANAATYGGGAAIAKNAYAFIAGVKGTAIATSYAYGKTDPSSTAVALGLIEFTARAGSAFVENGGTSTAYAAGESGAAGHAVIQGFAGIGKAYSTAKGTASTATPVESEAFALGLFAGRVQAAYAASRGPAYGGTGYVGLVPAYMIQGTAKATSTATAINTSAAPAESDAYSIGITGLYVQAGTGISYDQTSIAKGGIGKVGNIKGYGYSYATATGDGAEAFSATSGIGISYAQKLDVYSPAVKAKVASVASKFAPSSVDKADVYVSAANASGYTAYAGAGTVGTITGKGTSTATAIGAASNSVVKSISIAYGIKYATVEASDAFGITNAVGGTGAIGNITGAGSANASSTLLAGGAPVAGYATALAGGIKTSGFYAGDAYAYAPYSSATGGAGTIGTVTGTGTATAAGYVAKANSYGIDPVRLYAGVATGYSPYVYTMSVKPSFGSGTATTAIGGTGIIGAITGTATSTVTGDNANGYAYGIRNLYAFAGTAFSDSSYGSATGGSGTIGGITGTATTNVTTTDGVGHSYAKANGILDSTFQAGDAYGYNATAGVGSIAYKAAITGNATVTLNAVTTGYVSTGDVYGIGGVNIRAGSAFGSDYTYSTASGNTGVIGDITGTASITVTGTGSSVGVPRSAGIAYLALDAGYAYAADFSHAGAGTIANTNGIQGTLTATISGTVNTGSGFIGAQKLYGIKGLYAYAGAASTSHSSLSHRYSDGNTGSIGNIVGTATVALTGQTYGSGSIFAKNIAGIATTDLYVGSDIAGVYSKAGTGAIGNITGTASTTLTGTIKNLYGGKVYGIGNSGISNLSIHAGTAATSDTSYVLEGVAYAASGTIGAITGSSTLKVTGSTFAGAVYGNDSYGITALHIHAGLAYGEHLASGAPGTVTSITGSSTVTVTGTTYSGPVSAIKNYGFRSSKIQLGDAYGDTTNKYSLATAGASSLGPVTGSASTTLTGTTLGYSASVEAGKVYGVDKVDAYAGNATGYYATAPHSSIGLVKGTATSMVTANTSGAHANVYSGFDGGWVEGIYSSHFNAGVAAGSYAKHGLALSSGGSLGGLYGSAKATSTETGAHEYNSLGYAIGIEFTSAHLGNATGATATAGPGTVGYVTGIADSTAGSSVLSHSATSHAYGLDKVDVYAGNAKSSYAAGIAHAGAVTIGAITGTVNYSTATGSATAKVAASTTARGTGIYGLVVDGGNAYSSYKAYGATGLSSITSITGTGIATANAFNATADSAGFNALGYLYLGFPIGGVNVDSFLHLGNASGGSSAKSIATAGPASIGPIAGTATSLASAYSGTATVVGGTGDANGFGIRYLFATLSSANGYTATAAVGAVGTVTGKATVTATGYTANADSAFGIRDSGLYTGNATGSFSAKGAATTLAGSGIGNITGKAYAYATANAKGDASADAYGITDATFTTGLASATKATEAASSIGAIYGKAKAVATGFFSATIAKGIDPTSAHVGTGSIGAITGSAYAFSTGQNNGGATAHSYGIDDSTFTAGDVFGGKAGLGVITSITGTGKAYATGKGTGSYAARGYGISDLYANAGYHAGGSSAGSSIGPVTGKGTASNAAPGTVSGGSSDAGGITNTTTIYSGGSIGNITGGNYMGSTVDSSAGEAKPITGVTAKAGTSIGIIKAIATGTGNYAGGIHFSNFSAGTYIKGVYSKDAAYGDSIFKSNFRAIAPVGVAGIGYVTAINPAADVPMFGIADSAFTTSGSIGAINVTGSVFSTGSTTGFFAGDLLGAGYTIANAVETNGATIGAVKVTGYFSSADLVASVNNGGRTYFGNTADTGTTGAIGSVTVGLPLNPGTGASATFAVEAGTLGAISWGGKAFTPNVVIDSGFGEHVYVRVI